MAIVVFDPAEFRARFPHFTPEAVSDEQLTYAFDAATLLLDNSEASPVPYDPERGQNARKTLLYLLVCHLTTLALRAAQAGGAAGPAVSASEGSVSVSFAVPAMTGKAADWHQQTPCGQTFWQAARRYMTGGRYYQGFALDPMPAEAESAGGFWSAGVARHLKRESER
ncbi:MAG: DUF4054 domain-containing protein [Candidatus Adiutrix sp.]|jgi:hypothetical protein|nr:DUF4054 domain-containing protein [Candidatus Adiutrix sp.]